MMWEWRNDVQARLNCGFGKEISLYNKSISLKKWTIFFISHLDLYIQIMLVII